MGNGLITALLMAGVAAVLPAQVSPPQKATTTAPGASGIDTIVASAFSQAGAGGVVLVARDNGVVFRRAYGLAERALGVPMRPDHVFLVGSITKEFTGVAILRLVSEGRVTLDADIRTYVPSFNTHGRRITVEQVLTHTAGLPNIVDLPAFDSLARHKHSVDALLAWTRDVPLHFDPGTGFRYSDTGYFLLGAIIEQVSGRTYAEYVEQVLVAPLGMHNTYYVDDRVLPKLVRGYVIEDGVPAVAPFMDMSVPYAAGSIASSVDDLFLWHRALREGRVIPNQLLQRAWEGRTLPNGLHSGYGFGFKTCRIGDRRSVSHGGFVNGFGAQALMLRDDGIDVIVLVNNQSDIPDAGRLARRIARYLVTGVTTPKPYQLTAAERARLVGRYRIGDGDVREVFDSIGEMFSRRNGRTPVQLLPLSPTSLTLGDSEGDYIINFVTDSAGRVSRTETKLGCEPVDTGVRIP